MNRRYNVNQTVLAWLLIIVASFLCPAQSSASCTMGAAQAHGAKHACCVKADSCDCTTDLSLGWRSQHAGSLKSDCSCDLNREPAGAPARSEPQTTVNLAALKCEPGPITALNTLRIAFTSRPSLGRDSRFVPPSKSRAPPF